MQNGVTKESIAEETGLKVGDVVVRINETPMGNLNHKEAHEVIMKYGSTFVMGVIRPDEDLATEEEIANGQPFDVSNTENQLTQTPDSQAYSDMSEVTINTSRTESRSEEIKSEITDDHIAEMMSGEAEVLKEHNVIGVNFQRIMPKAGLFKSSEVFKHLNAEAMKTKADREQEVKRWTTFLQKPNRPILKSKEDIEYEQRKIEGYKIVIKKQPKPRCDPNRIPTPPPIKEPTPEPEPQPEIMSPAKEDDIEIIENIPADSEVPDLEANGKIGGGNDNEAITKEVEEQITSEETIDTKQDTQIVDKTEEELLIEKQLADVQKQLLALSHLPLTIQATLDAVTKQLADIMPVLKLQPLNGNEESNGNKVSEEHNTPEEETKLKNIGEDKSNDLKDTNANNHEIDSKVEEKVEERVEKNIKEKVEEKLEAKSAEIIPSKIENEIKEEPKSNVEANQITQEPENIPNTELVSAKVELTTEELIAKQKSEKVFRKQEEEWINKREKEQKQLHAELCKNLPNRFTKSPGGPLTPQERPLVLPGGRKWRNERDAYNEEFIAEVISSQAELIMGSTLGPIFESPLLGYDERVNFLKYKKPEKDLSNLKSSEVFKIVHNIEREPKHGIQVRPAKVLAEADIRNGTTPIPCL